MLVGFSSLGSFSTRFTAIVGENPTAYRDRWAARGGARIPGCYLFMRGAWIHEAPRSMEYPIRDRAISEKLGGPTAY